MLVDVYPDSSVDTLHVDLDAVFNVVSFPRKKLIGKADFYAATTGGRIHLVLSEGAIKDHTGPVEIKAHYSTAHERSQTSDVGVSATAASKDPVLATKISASLKATAGTKRTQKTSFYASERVLQPTTFGTSSIRWDFHSTRVEKVVSDFVSGNLWLEADVEPVEGRIAGSIEVVPEQILFYDTQRRALSTRKSIVMLISLWARGFRLGNTDGVLAKFEISHE